MATTKHERITVPTSLEDITVEQYQKLLELPEEMDDMDRLMQSVEILIGKPQDYLDQMERADLLKISELVAQIMTQQEAELQQRITIDGKTYGFHPNLSKLTVGEFADLETLCQQGYTDNLPQILGILYRPIVEEYGDFYRIENYDGEDRSEYFRQAPASVAVSASAFFLSIVERLAVALANYSEATKTEVDRRSVKNGGGLLQSSLSAATTSPSSQTSNEPKWRWPLLGWLTNKMWQA